MSSVKHAMENDDNKRMVAVNLLIQSGYLKTCDVHDNITYTVGGKDDVEKAYRLGNSLWDSELKGSFKTRREMTDAVQRESKNPDYGNDGCEHCRSFMAKD